jgi:hypothetical protein
VTRNLQINVYTTKEWGHIMKRSALDIETIAYGAFRASYHVKFDEPKLSGGPSMPTSA